MIQYYSIGYFDKPFTGDIKGNGYQLMNYTSSGNHKVKAFGIFAVMSSNHISDLTILNPAPHAFSHTTDYRDTVRHAGLTGWAFNSEFENCNVILENHKSYLNGKHNEDYGFGGLIGTAKNCKFENCSTDLKMSGKFGAHSGLVGRLINSDVNNCSGKLELAGFCRMVSPLFSEIDSSHITNCHVKCVIDSCEIKWTPTDNSGFGGIAAKVSNSLISECKTEAEVSAKGGYFGGIAAISNNTIFENCESKVNYSNKYEWYKFEGLGGIVSRSEQSKYINCSSILSSENNENYSLILVGGIVGVGKGNQIERCIANLNLRADSFAGGIIGESIQDSILNCSSVGRIHGKYLSNAGGIVGYYTSENPYYWNNAKGSIAYCSNNANIHGRDFIGGIAGEVGNFEVVCCENHGEVFAKPTYNTEYPGGMYAGGIVGYTGKIKSRYYDDTPLPIPTIQNCYNTGLIMARNNAGAISCGYSEAVSNDKGSKSEMTVNYCYNSGRVAFFYDGMYDEPVFASYNAEVYHSFWDITKTDNMLLEGGIGKFTREMKDKDTYLKAGWDFDNIWEIDSDTNNGYPFFKSDSCRYTLDFERTTFDEECVLFPNPATDYIYIGNLDAVENIRIYIRDMTGKLVYDNEEFHYLEIEKIYNSDYRQYTTVNISHLPKGVYALEICLKDDNYVMDLHYKRNMYKMFIKE
jgi:hypothetical protein